MEDYLEATVKFPDDILLLDVGLPGGMTGIEGIKFILEKSPIVEIIILTTFDDTGHIFQALSAGATSYMTKRTPLPRIAEAIMTVHHGGAYMSPAIAKMVIEHFAPKQKSTAQLTPRQAQITNALVRGLSYKKIAEQLLISPETVRDHIKRIYAKLQVHSRAELISVQMKGGLEL